jgi:hypothetical protein
MPLADDKAQLHFEILQPLSFGAPSALLNPALVERATRAQEFSPNIIHGRIGCRCCRPYRQRAKPTVGRHFNEGERKTPP